MTSKFLLVRVEVIRVLLKSGAVAWWGFPTMQLHQDRPVQNFQRKNLFIVVPELSINTSISQLLAVLKA